MSNLKESFDLSSLGDISVRNDLGGAELTTFGVGGGANSLFEPQSIEVLQALLARLHREGLNYRILGAGSNVVFPDEGIVEPVIRLGKSLGGFLPLDEPLRDLNLLSQLQKKEIGVTSDARRLLVFASAPMMSLSRKVSQLGLSGLEFAAGIPGTMGGAVRMNAGAHGHSSEEIIDRVHFVDENGILRTFEGSDLGFRYRHTELPPSAIVVAAELILVPKDPKTVSEERSSCLEYRKRTQPLQLRSAGSVFRNPSLEAAGSLLERSGLKGERRGAIRYSELHANWLVADRYEGGSSTPPEIRGRAGDILDLVRLGQSKVYERFGITLEPEIIFW